jgi:hypothetical protein
MKITLENIAAIFTILGFIVIVCQLYLQLKKDRIELILKLSADFFNNPKFMSVFKILDSDKLADCNNLIIKIIGDKEVKLVDGKVIDPVEEIDLNSYMNFFNSLAILVEEKIVSKSDVMKLFRYQLEKTFASIEMIRYMEDYGFDRIKLLLPNSFFFYGTLESQDDREVLDDVKPISSFLVNSKKIELHNYKIEKVGLQSEYEGLVKSKGKDVKPIKLSEVLIVLHADWTKIFETLDSYEEVDSLYSRAIIQVNNSKHYVWVYIKKLQ